MSDVDNSFSGHKRTELSVSVVVCPFVCSQADADEEYHEKPDSGEHEDGSSVGNFRTPAEDQGQKSM